MKLQQGANLCSNLCWTSADKLHLDNTEILGVSHRIMKRYKAMTAQYTRVVIEHPAVRSFEDEVWACFVARPMTVSWALPRQTGF